MQLSVVTVVVNSVPTFPDHLGSGAHFAASLLHRDVAARQASSQEQTAHLPLKTYVLLVARLRSPICGTRDDADSQSAACAVTPCVVIV